MPTFCRHNRFLANCPICAREAAEAAAPRRPGVRSSGGPVTRKRASGTGARRAGDLRVRRVAREHDDGFRSPLVPGVKASGDAERLAEEIAFAAARLVGLAADPPGLYAEVAAVADRPTPPGAGRQPPGGDRRLPAAERQPSTADREEAAWLAFLVAYLCPVEGEDPFVGVRAARRPWAAGEMPRLDEEVPLGPRTAHDPARGDATVAAYRAWAARAGSQEAAFAGEPGWSPERRFARAFERLALPGLHRDARFDLLVTLGGLGVHELRAGSLQLGGSDETTVAAKRVFGIGDTLVLERRAADLAAACEVPLAALDLGLWNWSKPPRPPRPGLPPAPARATLGFPAAEPDPDVYARTVGALGL